MNYEIKKGDRFLCLKDFVMYDGDTAYIEGKEYVSEKDNCITDEQCDKKHVMSNEHDFFEYFKKLTVINEEAKLTKYRFTYSNGMSQEMYMIPKGVDFFTEDSPYGKAVKTGILDLPKSQGAKHKVTVEKL